MPYCSPVPVPSFLAQNPTLERNDRPVEESEFSELWAWLLPRAYSFAARHLGGTTDPDRDEVVQEAGCALLRAVRNQKIRAAVPAVIGWLRSTVETCATRLRRARYLHSLRLVGEDSLETCVADMPEVDEMLDNRALLERVARLGPALLGERRWGVTASRLAGSSYQEIAAKYGVHPERARVDVWRGLRELAAAFR